MSTAQQDTNLIGCDFDAATAKALSGNDIVALVTDKTGTDLLAVSGQQGLKFNMSQDNTEAATKDDAIGGWTLKFASSKSWDASIDGLYSPDDSATKTVAKALAEGEYLCLKVCKRIRTSANTKYVPLRMGLALVSSDSFEAPNDDNATYSMEFQGTGKPWLYETASEEQITAATVTVSNS